MLQNFCKNVCEGGPGDPGVDEQLDKLSVGHDELRDEVNVPVTPTSKGVVCRKKNNIILTVFIQQLPCLGSMFQKSNRKHIFLENLEQMYISIFYEKYYAKLKKFWD